jgi:hypothetical protein
MVADHMAGRKRSGWFKESRRHSMASRGIKTSPESTVQKYPKWYLGVGEMGSHTSDVYTQLNLKKDIEKGLVSPNYNLKDAQEDLIFVTTDMMMALNEIASDKDEDQDTRDDYAVAFNEANAIAEYGKNVFERDQTLTHKDAKTWEKWMNIAFENTKDGAPLDLTDAYADAMEKYFGRLARDSDDPIVRSNAERCQLAAH